MINDLIVTISASSSCVFIELSQCPLQHLELLWWNSRRGIEERGIEVIREEHVIGAHIDP